MEVVCFYKTDGLLPLPLDLYTDAAGSLGFGGLVLKLTG